MRAENARLCLVLLAFCAALYGWQRGFSFSATSEAERANIPANMPRLLLPPSQGAAAAPLAFSLNGFNLRKAASYTVTARILGTSRYFLGWQSDLAPVDLVLGWGLMADKRVNSKVSISQSGRFYRWHTREYPMPPEQIVASSANTHIIPASGRVEKIVKSLRKNQVVTLKGSLVNAARDDGVYWNTSLTRTDEGDGSCELFYVEDVTIY